MKKIKYTLLDRKRIIYNKAKWNESSVRNYPYKTLNTI